MVRADSDWADAGAFAALVATAALVLREIARELRDDGEPHGVQPRPDQ
jgi:hypothetical protein